jgi:hypothetical protein
VKEDDAASCVHGISRRSILGAVDKFIFIASRVAEGFTQVSYKEGVAL